MKTLGFTPKRYPPGTVIFSQGEDNDRVFIVESGWGCLSHELAGGQRQILDFALRGDLVMSRSNGGGALETFVAQTDLNVLVASTKTFTLTAMKSPHLFSLIVEALGHNGAVIAEHLTNVGRRSALARTAHLFLELRTRLELIGSVTRDSYECPLTQYDLADALGLTPIHVNRMLRELRERKFLEFRQGRVRVLDLRGMTEYAGFERSYIDS
ncbi:Crp/Fnr family transcriptional regulator [Mesorhizobium sp. ESP7-2]|uniref:Crp/Fnr family transcriptional regulator n=1 Tax=unclassified Mesorhizobium TaxID=325217 RepID=UPI001CC9DC58|nr:MULTISPECIES: Crp/Fnr family transcriptional regulator [unclassified Mesorhizobium]MBZ9709263.1 Crp/Fnr family transcriptional regulator [Mesorhizobium sp. ESP7-2]